MNSLVSLLKKQFGEDIPIHVQDGSGKKIYVWIGVENISYRSLHIYVNSLDDPPKGDKNKYICLAEWKPEMESLDDLLIIKDESIFPPDPLSLVQTKDHYAILDGNEDIIHMSDSRMKEILPWLDPGEFDTDVFTLDEYLSLSCIPYKEEYSLSFLDDTHIWQDMKGNIIASIPPLTEKQKKLLPILETENYLEILPLVKSILDKQDVSIECIWFEHRTLFCILGIVNDRIIFSIRDDIEDLSIHPIFRCIPAKEAISYMYGFQYWIHKMDTLYDEFIHLTNNFKVLKEKVQRKDTLEIDAQYAISRMEVGYPYYLNVQPRETYKESFHGYSKVMYENTQRDFLLDKRVREILHERNLPHVEMEYKVHMEWHDDPIFDMKCAEDIPQHILKQARIVDVKEGGCCSQRECGGYTLKFNILIIGQELTDTSSSE